LEDHRQELEEKNETLLVRATTDALTGLYNRQYFNDRLLHSLQYSERYTQPISLIMFDLDKFKEINDTHGHLAGDTALRELSELIRKNIRESDIIARWGGEEFMVLTFQTDIKIAEQIGVKLREVVAEASFSVGHQITCSFGVATYKPGETATELLNRVDGAMYSAKLSGRNAVVVA
jgi:diguanylate cyclase (GGDEF)-like protein